MNPYEQAARQRKTLALVAALERRAREQGISDEELARAVRGLSDSDWAAVAAKAGTHPPSEITRALVIDTLEATLGVDPFARFGGVA